MTEVKNYCNNKFSDYPEIHNNPNYLKNLFYPWKRNCVKFKFYSIYENTFTKNNLPFLPYVNYSDGLSEKELMYNITIIYASDFHLKRLAESKNLFLDCTYIHPPEFYQLLILMYLDNICYYE